MKISHWLFHSLLIGDSRISPKMSLPIWAFQTGLAKISFSRAHWDKHWNKLTIFTYFPVMEIPGQFHPQTPYPRSWQFTTLISLPFPLCYELRNKLWKNVWQVHHPHSVHPTKNSPFWPIQFSTRYTHENPPFPCLFSFIIKSSYWHLVLLEYQSLLSVKTWLWSLSFKDFCALSWIPIATYATVLCWIQPLIWFQDISEAGLFLTSQVTK